MATNPFVQYHLAYPNQNLPPLHGLYDYVLARDGLYLRAQRAGLAITLPIAACEVRGLAEVQNEFTYALPRVPLALTQALLTGARAEKDRHGHPVEVLYHLSLADDEWALVKPAQKQTRTAVQPLPPYTRNSYASYLIEVHSHHELDFHKFSTTDDASEGSKFRFFGLLTNIFKHPALHLRLNVYGYKVEVPASVVFELPEALVSTDDTEQWLLFYETFNVREAMPGRDALTDCAARDA